MIASRARHWGGGATTAGLLVVAGSLATYGCGAAGPNEPAAAGPGRYVLSTVGGQPLPSSVYRGAGGYVELTADTLWLTEGGPARRVSVLHTVSYGAIPDQGSSLGPAGSSTAASATAGAWRASGASVEIILAGAYGPDTLRLAARPDGGLASAAGNPAAVYARR